MNIFVVRKPWMDTPWISSFLRSRFLFLQGELPSGQRITRQEFKPEDIKLLAKHQLLLFGLFIGVFLLFVHIKEYVTFP